MASEKVRLNGFQQMMLRWETLCPMNGVHVVELGSAHPENAVYDSIVQTCERLQLMPVTIHKRLRQVDYSAAKLHVPFCVHEFSGSKFDELESVLTDELNRPFESDAHWPFRFVLCNAPEDRQFLILVYQHALSDSRGISLLLREIIRHLNGDPPKLERFQLGVPEFSRLFPQAKGLGGRLKRMREILGILTNSLSVFIAPRQLTCPIAIKPKCYNRTLATKDVLQTARSQGVTVQALLFAALAEAFSLHYQRELKQSRRKTLRLHTPVDLRKEAGVMGEELFGQLLGTISVTATFASPQSFLTTLKSIHDQMQAIKRTGEYRDQIVKMEFMSLWWDQYPKRMNRVALPALIPSSGFVSNVNLTTLLEDEVQSGAVKGYFRFTGSGLSTPMMLGITTLGETLHLTTTHHRELFTTEEINRIVAHVVWRITGNISQPASREQFLNQEIHHDEHEVKNETRELMLQA